MPTIPRRRGRALQLVLPTVSLLVLPAVPFCSAGGAPGRPTEDPHHEVSVDDNRVTMPALPGFRLRVSDAFRYLGSTSFPLDDRSQVDVVIFAEVDDAEIRRVVRVQIESLTDPGANDYHWEGVDTLEVSGAEYLLGYWCFDAEEVARERPHGDTARVRGWLTARGYLQSGVFVGTRLARIFDDGRSELLVFYGETTALTGVDCADEDAAMEHLPSIVRRAEAAVTIEE